MHGIQTVLDCRVLNTEQQNGLLCIGQFRNLGQNGKCYCIFFDELTDIHIYMYVVVYTQVHVCSGSGPEYTNSRKDFILGPKLEDGGTLSFQFS